MSQYCDWHDEKHVGKPRDYFDLFFIDGEWVNVCKPAWKDAQEEEDEQR